MAHLLSRIRGRGALIRGTNGRSNGIVPFLETLDAGVAAVNQGGRRKGAACVYLEPWHPDVEEFLELRDNTGEESRRTHNLNLATWIPPIFACVGLKLRKRNGRGASSDSRLHRGRSVSCPYLLIDRRVCSTTRA